MSISFLQNNQLAPNKTESRIIYYVRETGEVSTQSPGHAITNKASCSLDTDILRCHKEKAEALERR